MCVCEGLFDIVEIMLLLSKYLCPVLPYYIMYILNKLCIYE